MGIDYAGTILLKERAERFQEIMLKGACVDREMLMTLSRLDYIKVQSNRLS